MQTGKWEDNSEKVRDLIKVCQLFVEREYSHWLR